MKISILNKLALAKVKRDLMSCDCDQGPTRTVSLKCPAALTGGVTKRRPEHVTSIRLEGFSPQTAEPHRS